METFAPDPPPPAPVPEAPEEDLAWLDDILGSTLPLPGGIEAGAFTPARLEEDEPISLAGVAARLEQVAASLRQRSAEELIADWRSASVADPLETLLTGFVLGYEQGRDRRE